jgi:hypothetical protein
VVLIYGLARSQSRLEGCSFHSAVEICIVLVGSFSSRSYAFQHSLHQKAFSCLSPMLRSVQGAVPFVDIPALMAVYHARNVTLAFQATSKVWKVQLLSPNSVLSYVPGKKVKSE